MRLLLVTPLYPPEAGGPAPYAALIEKGLPIHGIDMTVLKFRDVRHLPKIVRHVALFLRILKEGKEADVLMVQDTISCGIPATLTSMLLQKPLVLRVPGDYAWEQGRQRYGVLVDLDGFQRWKGPWEVEALRSLQQFVARRADLVIAQSQYFAGIIRAWGVSPSRITTIYHGIEIPALIRPERQSGLLMVSMGRLVPWKGFRTLIQLMPELPRWHLMIIGDGPDRDLLNRTAREAGVEDRITFTGSLPRAEALGWLSVADAFVLNSSFESFSFQIGEALMLGASTIATTAGSIPELIENGKEGVLVRPSDRAALAEALRSIEEEPALWQARRKAAKEKAEMFSADRMLEETAHALLAL